MAEQMTRDTDKDKDTPPQGVQHPGTMGGSDIGSMGQTGNATTEQGGGMTEQARNMVRNLGEQARSAVADPGATAQDLARRAREQASTAGDMLYQQGSRAGEYLSRNINEYPFAALLIAGAVGYGLAYLVHGQWQSWNWQDWNLQGSTDGGERNSRRTQR
jgi:ElaB/YqjD/DUF883 family membrane-anchored ribosome-binding protein